MNIIADGRSYGRAVQFIQESAKTGIPIITPHKMYANYIKELANKLQIQIPEPISIENVSHGNKVTFSIIDTAIKF